MRGEGGKTALWRRVYRGGWKDEAGRGKEEGKERKEGRIARGGGKRTQEARPNTIRRAEQDTIRRNGPDDESEGCMIVF